MFAPPVPPSGSRPASAASHHPPYAHQPYDLPRSPMHNDPPASRSRHNSYSWRPDAGLPPPPSQIDDLGDDLAHRLIPSPAHHHHQHQHQHHHSHHTAPHRSRSRSPAPHSPSRYDLEFGHHDDSSTHHDSSPMPLNSVSKHPKLKLEVVLASNIYEAGGTISGRLEITCSTSQKLRLGEIAVELEGIEELSSRDHAATQLFLYNRTLFQGEHLPPSNAVLPAAPHNGYWTARKGRTTFPFSFRLPSTAPSSVAFSGNAALRYQLKASAQTWWNDERTVVTSRREAFVVEKWSDEFDEKYRQPAEAIGDTRLFMGGHGAVWLEAGVVEQLFWGGGQVLIRCGIKNNTKRQVAGIKVALARRLIFPVGSADGAHDRPDQVSLEPRITEVVHEQHFKGREYEFPPGEEAVCNVAVDVPRDLRTIRKTRLFEIRIFALVSLVLGSFAKDLTVEIPIYVAHTASVQKPARADLDQLHPDPARGRIPDRPHSVAGHTSHHHPHHPHHGHQPHQHEHFRDHPHHQQHHAPHHDYAQLLADPQMAAVEQHAADRGWSPAPVHPGGFTQMPSRPASAARPGIIQLPSSPQPFSFSNVAPGQLEWNPAATAWNPSQLLQGAAIPRSASAAPNLGYPAMQGAPVLSAAPQAPMQWQQPGAASPQPLGWQPPQRSYSVSPGPISPAMQQQPPPQSLVMAALSVAPTAAASSHLLNQQPRRASGPGSFAEGAESMGAGGWSPQPPQPQQPSSLASASQEQLARMPEPGATPAPAQSLDSANLAQAPPQPGYAPDPLNTGSGGGFGPGPMPLVGLATIDEDGESQAGTVKSMAALGTLGKPQGSPNAGNSVSRNDIEQFEAMARAEEDEEEVKRRMAMLGMIPDESAFRPRKAGPATRDLARDSFDRSDQSAPDASTRAHDVAIAKEAQSLPKPPVPSGKSQAAASSSRPRASDIFATAQKARGEGQDAQAAVAALGDGSSPASRAEAEPFSSLQRSAEREREASNASTRTVRPDASSPPSGRRSSLSQGKGLSALEHKLERSTTPKITASPSMPVMTLANLGHDDDRRSSSPLTSPGKTGSARSRKESSSLRAAAAAREAALLEKERREAEDAQRRRAQEEERRRTEEERARLEEEHQAAAERAKAAEADRRRRAEEEDRRKREAAAAAAAAEAEAKEEEERLSRQTQRQMQQQQEQERGAAEAEARRRQEEEQEAEEERRRAREEAKRAAERERIAEEAKQARDRSEASRTLQNIPAAHSSSRSRTTDGRPLSASASPAQRQAADGVTQHSALKKEAASRVAGWLSSSNSPSPSLAETPGTPSCSVISMLKRDDAGSSKLSFPVRSPSQVRNPLYQSPTRSSPQSSSTPKAADGENAAASAAIPRSYTTANIASSSDRPEGASRERARSYVHIDEPLPALSAELRALVDSSDIQPARRAGTALRDHPISRKISTSSAQAADASHEARAVGSTSASLSASTRRDRHTSLPAWPKPGLPNIGSGRTPLPGLATLDQSSLPAAKAAATTTTATAGPSVVNKAHVQPRRSVDIFSGADREIVVPSRVEKTLSVANAAGVDGGQPSGTSGPGGYDARSARGGRGGRVASVAQLWSSIAGDTVPDAGSVHDGPSPPPPSGTFKPKARRTSAVGGAPALDFSKSSSGAGASGNRKGAVTTMAAAFASQVSSGGSSKPESLKSGSAPQFLNTSAPKPVFSSTSATSVSPSPSASSVASSSSVSVSMSASTSTSARTGGERRPLPQPKASTLLGGAPVSAPRLVRPIPQSPSNSSVASAASSSAAAPPAAGAGREGSARTRKISSDLLSTFDRPPQGGAGSAAPNSGSKVALDSTILDALAHPPPTTAKRTSVVGDENLRLPIAGVGEVKMSGRGTTKAIGSNKLRDLKAVWGN
ncbi:uncharacterized protein PFL1_05057 [Pseudozyma flocculosa PF-1]|uniref:Arrestin C-terminal-like domain-containing protein n=2 Tax=Pseudozyma flocculosa TaxID=84751 RepID=A0A5C3EXE4_9BASI|nr:uncharacterized protein PFL1_05057 [Pseudozyma flocculosa PF-1]EPQ27519.1 hypothetical protein PFL1_05057 [Pseudozyma flocculosa PF-1]SPO36047.1 uncharacterized protein PSFLO_01518 [Pseudozyma flocculosa]